MRGSRDICYRYYTRFSHRARDDVWPGEGPTIVESASRHPAAGFAPAVRNEKKLSLKADDLEVRFRGLCGWSSPGVSWPSCQ